jgi:hypothetical protein
MTRDQWQRVKGVAAAALDLPHTDRRAYVAGACAGDETFAREVFSLLTSAVSAEGLFESPVSLTPAAAAALDEAAGAAAVGIGVRIAQYRIVREIGRGGMGRVFLAERADDEYHQRVALKIAHVRSPDVLRWFREERQILARLDHPNIARLMDGGTDRQASIDLMVSQLETGDVLARRGDHAAAAEHYRLSIARGESLAASDPGYVYYRLTLASGLTRLAQTLIASDRAEDARPLVVRATDLVQKASTVDPADVRLRFELALAHAAMGDIESQAAHAESARAWYRRALDIMIPMRDSGQLAGGTLNGDEPRALAEIERKLAAD